MIRSRVISPLDGGLLTGKYRRGQHEPEGTRRAAQWDEPPVHDMEALHDIVDVLAEVEEAHDATPAQVALAWLLACPCVASLVIGARTDAQLAVNLKAAALSLAPEALRRLEEASRRQLAYPYWHQRKTAADRLSAGDLVLLGPHLED